MRTDERDVVVCADATPSSRDRWNVIAALLDLPRPQVRNDEARGGEGHRVARRPEGTSSREPIGRKSRLRKGRR